jgi:tyrosinase
MRADPPKARVRLRDTVRHLKYLAFVGLLGAPATAAAQPAVEIEINNTASVRDDYIAWSPAPARIRVSSANGATGTIAVVLSNLNPAVGGQLRFAKYLDPWPAGTTATQDRVDLELPADGRWMPFVVAGQYMRPSTSDGDAVIVVRTAGTNGVILGRKELMVRVRKDANRLTAEERTRFLEALSRLNAQGGYAVFQQIHSLVSRQGHSSTGHTAFAFLPWHRALLVAFERALQEIDPSVALPYWRFDQPAPNVFSEDFMGAPVPGSMQPRFAQTNKLSRWTIDGLTGIERRPRFAPDAAPNLQGEEATLNQPIFAQFRAMEANPHSPAHVQAGGGGWLGTPRIAVRDPLFFLLHANIDRLWALWEVENQHFDPASPDAYTLQGSSPVGSCSVLGHYSLDTMWPWNGAVQPADPCRPASAPGGAFPPIVPGVFVPPQHPRPHDLIDFRMSAAGMSGAGFAYDSVPFN